MPGTKTVLDFKDIRLKHGEVKVEFFVLTQHTFIGPWNTIHYTVPRSSRAHLFV